MDVGWKEYEYQCVEYHKKKNGHIVYHESEIPDDELFNSGYIHDFNKLRFRRKGKIRCKKNKERNNLYGIDFLCKDPMKNTYHGGQCKAHKNNLITATDIGTFQSTCVNRFKTIGYLYTTSDLQIDLKDDLLNNPNSIKHHKLCLKEHEHTQNVSNKEVVIKQSYNFQENAHRALINEHNNVDEHNRFSLQSPCGTGKTLMCGNYLKHCKFPLIICIAPLITSVDNLYERIPIFIPEYDILLVDSNVSNGGTTYIDYIEEWAASESKYKIIFSTFDSAQKILSQLSMFRNPENDWCFVVDEVHMPTKH